MQNFTVFCFKRNVSIFRLTMFGVLPYFLALLWHFMALLACYTILWRIHFCWHFLIFWVKLFWHKPCFCNFFFLFSCRIECISTVNIPSLPFRAHGKVTITQCRENAADAYMVWTVRGNKHTNAAMTVQGEGMAANLIKIVFYNLKAFFLFCSKQKLEFWSG